MKESRNYCGNNKLDKLYPSEGVYQINKIRLSTNRNFSEGAKPLSLRV